jgi:hypothetical protein
VNTTTPSLERLRAADPTVRDAIYHATPADWAEHFGRDEARDLLRPP